MIDWAKKKLREHPSWMVLFGKGLRFGITSFTALLLHFLINVIGHEVWHISVNILYPISLVAISLSTFLQCRFFVYPGATEKNAARQGGEFIAASVIFRCLEWGLFSLLFNIVGLWYIFCIIIVQICGTLSKFLFFNFFIFGHIKKSEKVETEDFLKME